MDQRRGRMKSPRRLPEHVRTLVRLFNGPCKRTIGGSRRRYFGEPEQWESIAARELKRDACDRNCDHECIKHTMCEPAGAIEPFAKRRGFGWWRRIHQPPQQTYNQDGEDHQSPEDMYGQAHRICCAFGNLSSNVPDAQGSMTSPAVSQ